MITSGYRINESAKLIVLTGAGISAESGIKTFRDQNGLWKNYRIEEVASPQAFWHEPETVWEFYLMRYRQLAKVAPNAAHRALADLENTLGDNFTLITQNVDDLHQRAGSARILPMHGSLSDCRCVKCRIKFKMTEINLEQQVPLCPRCGGLLRPDIVWFGETPYHLDDINTAIDSADYLIVVGTSGVVYPAAGFLSQAKFKGAVTIGINLQKPDNFRYFDEFHQGKASELLPELLKTLLGEKS
jgi:NAD-dependent deacetylase